MITPELPQLLQIEISSYCNLKCTMCPLTTKDTSSGVTPGHLSKSLWDKIVPIAETVGNVVITGFGEPLMNPECIHLLQELNERNVQTSLTTNGVALSPQIAEQLAALAHLHHINISVDSPDPQVYQSIRNGKLEKALQGIENLMAVIDNPERVTVSSVLMNSNIASLPDFPVVLAGLGVQTYVLQGVVGYLPELEEEENPLHQKHLSKYLAKIKSACKKAGIILRFTLPARLDLEIKDPAEAIRKYSSTPETASDDETRQCCLPWEIPFINKDGLVFPCCYAVTGPDAVMGDLNTASLEQIWTGERYRAFRRNLLHGKTMPPVCRKCNLASLGEHPLLYSAKILYDQSVLENQVCMRLVVQNTGSKAWHRNDLVRIGTIAPIDRLSSYVHPTWLGANRITGFSEKSVAPGGTATFKFRINPSDDVPAESFQVVFEGTRWLPNTRVEIRPGQAKEHPLRLFVYEVWNRFTGSIGAWLRLAK